MAKKKDGAGKKFLRLSLAFMLGLLALAIAAALFVFLLPLIVVAALGAFVLVIVFFVIWGVIYLAMIAGTAIYYFFKPMQVKKKGRYSIRKAKEAGRRSKG